MDGSSNSKPGAQPTKEQPKPTKQPFATKNDQSDNRASFAGVPTGPRSLSKRPAHYLPPAPKTAPRAPVPGAPTGPKAMRKPMQQSAVKLDPDLIKLSDQEIEQKLMANQAEAERIARRLATLEAQEAADSNGH
ncbi:hypothetical protein CKM354_001190300 [Cercospora kikuchii]|uniref:Uncharacterized protein n=1 Tax=Cercospora kikuchii TaxID=84275 RepID=A0A9P3CTV5_9PEZI|nr:uncharacterized protein CKM354_001190300 [Cercospora kikuchii]GIZ48859.1 hypothetical protein CKM354_001190300 [Cercospora kikuchii]